MQTGPRQGHRSLPADESDDGSDDSHMTSPPQSSMDNIWVARSTDTAVHTPGIEESESGSAMTVCERILPAPRARLAAVQVQLVACQDTCFECHSSHATSRQ
jgi:hypothetical protein